MALINALIVHPDDRVERIKIGNRDLAVYQAIVGGYIEGIYGRIATVYVNEEGLILNLEPNPSVSLFVERFLAKGSYYRLHGTALIVGPPDEEGNDTHVRQSVVSYYMMEN